MTPRLHVFLAASLLFEQGAQGGDWAPQAVYLVDAAQSEPELAADTDIRRLAQIVGPFTREPLVRMEGGRSKQLRPPDRAARRRLLEDSWPEVERLAAALVVRLRPHPPSLGDIRCTFDALVHERESREDVASWAALWRRIDDDTQWTDTAPNRDAIWDALDALSAADIEVDEGDYLYHRADFEGWRADFQLASDSEETRSG